MNRGIKKFRQGLYAGGTHLCWALGLIGLIFVPQRVHDGGCHVPGLIPKALVPIEGLSTIHQAAKLFVINMDLPEDLIVEIFSRLPQKDILRSKCVCRSWYNLFSHQSFTTNYSRNSPFTALLFADKNDCSALHLTEVAPSGEFLHRPPMKIKVPDYCPQKHKALSVIGSCNGLVFILLRKYNYYHLYPNASTRNVFDKIYYCNPVLGGGCFPVTEDIEIKGRCASAYELGFCPSTNCVKILRILYGGHSTVRQADILTVGSGNNWRQLEYSTALFISDSVGVHINGFRNWFGSDENPERIRIFDYMTEKPGRLSTPPGLLHVSGTKNMNLAAMNDHLCLIDLSNNSELIIWCMQEYGVADSWSRNCILRRNWFPDICGWRFGEILPVIVLPDGDILFSVNYLGKIFCFSPGRKKCSEQTKVVRHNATYDLITMYATDFAPRFHPLKG